MSSRATQVRSARPRSRRTGEGSLRVVRSEKKGLIRRRRARRLAPAVAIGAIFVGAAIFTVLIMQVSLAQTGFKMAEMREEILKAEGEHAKLVLKAAKLSSKERIERVAIDRLGLIAPEEVNYIVANVRTRAGDFLARTDTPTLLPGSGTAAGELGSDGP